MIDQNLPGNGWDMLQWTGDTVTGDTVTGERATVADAVSQSDATAYAPVHAQFRQPQACTIAAIETDNYRTKTFVLDGRLDAVPGQFVMAWLPRFDEKPFSLVAADPITLMITAVGPFTRLVHELRVGDRLWLRGPFGRGYVPPEAGTETNDGSAARRVALVAGGYGVAPLLWLARTLLAGDAESRPSIHAIIGARSQADLLYGARFEQLLAAHHTETGAPRHQLSVTTDDGSAGIHGRVPTALAPGMAQGEIGTVFACGPDPMLAAVRALCAEHGVSAQLSWEAYMRCGVGLCGSCEHEGRLLCMDGPVLQE